MIYSLKLRPQESDMKLAGAVHLAGGSGTIWYS